MISPEHQHSERLEHLCVKALSQGDFLDAFMYADRRCRIPPLAMAHHYLLRAEALKLMDEGEAALADVRRALEIAPEDLQSNRRMLSWGGGRARVRAAQVLIEREFDSRFLIKALKVLKAARREAVVSLRMLDDRVEGWAFWSGDADIVLTIESEDYRRTMSIWDDAAHPLAGIYDKVASFTMDRPGGAAAAVIRLACGDTILRTTRTPARQSGRTASSPEADVTWSEGVTVIVPVYGDYRATRNCLESLEPELSTAKQRQAIVVDDASPDPKIRSYLNTLSRCPAITLVRNQANLGFVGAVNHALTLAPRGDIVLLNADTLVSSRFLDRLQAIARANPNVGTITPLSNNGEFTSFPVPNRANRLPSAKRLALIDMIAARTNADRLIDIPNGIGFCLYITRPCLDSLGSLSENYQRGYFEDVDFCLRARERGFRNVCATSVYVGHAGSRSFGADKRALVVKNLTTLESKFRDYRQECAAFVAADPLRPARVAIERAMPPARFDRLLVAGTGIANAIAERRARELARQKTTVLLMLVDCLKAKPAVTLLNPSKGLPQSLAFELDRQEETKALQAYLAQARSKRIEVVDVARLSEDIWSVLRALGKPIDLLVTGSDGANRVPAKRRKPDRRPQSSAQQHVRPIEQRILFEGFDRVLAQAGGAGAFAKGVVRGRPIILADKSARPRSRPSPPHSRARCGIITAGVGGRDTGLILDIGRLFARRWPDANFIVLGTTLDDLGAMASGNVFVCGRMLPTEYEDAFRHYRLDRLLVAAREPLLGHPNIDAAGRSPLPVAYFDWSPATWKSRKFDLVIDPDLDNRRVAIAIGRWLTGSR